MARKQFEQSHNQRPGQPQQGRAKGHPHTAKLRIQPVHQTTEHIHARVAFLRGKAANGVDQRRNGGRQTVESAQKAKENQKVDDIPRDLAGFVHPRGH